MIGYAGKTLIGLKGKNTLLHSLFVLYQIVRRWKQFEGPDSFSVVKQRGCNIRVTNRRHLMQHRSGRTYFWAQDNDSLYVLYVLFGWKLSQMTMKAQCRAVNRPKYNYKPHCVMWKCIVSTVRILRQFLSLDVKFRVPSVSISITACTTYYCGPWFMDVTKWRGGQLKL